MLANRAYLGRLRANHDVAAIAAFPNLHFALFKHALGLYIRQERAIALFVFLFNGRHAAELLGQIVEALFIGFAGHARVHVRPLGILALGRVQKVFRRVAQLAQVLEPQLGVLLLILRRLQEQRGNLLKALFLGHRSEIGVLVARLRFARERFPQVLFRARARIRVLARRFYDFFKLIRRSLADGAGEIRRNRPFMHIAANLALPFFHVGQPPYFSS